MSLQNCEHWEHCRNINIFEIEILKLVFVDFLSGFENDFFSISAQKHEGLYRFVSSIFFGHFWVLLDLLGHFRVVNIENFKTVIFERGTPS